MRLLHQIVSGNNERLESRQLSLWVKIAPPGPKLDTPDLILCWLCITDLRNISLQFTETAVPAQETTYICQVFTIPDDQVYHLIATKPIITNQHVMHHTLIYGCPDGVGKLSILSQISILESATEKHDPKKHLHFRSRSATEAREQKSATERRC